MKSMDTILIGGSLAALVLLMAKSRKSSSSLNPSLPESNNDVDQMEKPKDLPSLDDLFKEIEQPKQDQVQEPDQKNEEPKNPNQEPNPEPNPEPPKQNKYEFVPNKPPGDPKPDEPKLPGFDPNPKPPHGQGLQVDGVKNNPNHGSNLGIDGIGINEGPWQKFVITDVPTRGYYYTVRHTDFGSPAFGSHPAKTYDPLMHIVKNAYDRWDYTDDANMAIARELNNYPYNQRFRHTTDPAFNPNQKITLTKNYGSLKDQYLDSKMGSYRTSNLFNAEYPTIFIP